MSETVEQRRRRKFAAGAVDQAATFFSGLAVGVFTAGVVAPGVAALVSLSSVTVGTLVLLGGGGVVMSAVLAALAALLKGRAKTLDDDNGAAANSGVAIHSALDEVDAAERKP